jgi:hypothetical protein
MSIELETATAIPLNAWQDPQGDVVLRYSRERCHIYFGCWVDAGTPADYLCELTFHNAWAARGLCLEGAPYKTNPHSYHSFILVVEESRWLQQLAAQRLEYYPRWKSWDTREYLHYVVEGHDNYYDIVATGFDEAIVFEADAGELTALIRGA